MKLVYNDTTHAYFLDGRRCKSVSAVAKIPVDTFQLEQWAQRQVAIGLAMDRNLVENVAVDIDNRDAINTVVERAKETASAHRAADRGTQMHRVLNLVLRGEEDKLLTDQQQRDADMLKRTLDKYKLQPHADLTEQFVAYPDHAVAGRFDAILERPDGTQILADLKSGPNAVTYPHSTSVQLALYAHAEHVAHNAATKGDRSDVTDWRSMPPRLNLNYAYVVLAEPDAAVGTLHEIDIAHGWQAARTALWLVNWRKALDYGKRIANEIAPPTTDFAELVQQAADLDALRTALKQAQADDALTDELRAVAAQRSLTLVMGGVAMTSRESASG